MWYMFSLWHPEMMLAVFGIGVLYFYAAKRPGKCAMKEQTFSWNRGLTFILFLVVMYVALGSPVSLLAQNRFFSVYILQSLLTNLVMPWLLLVSIPPWMYTAVFQVDWIYQTCRFLTRPFVALILYNALATLFFIPSIFEANLRYNWLHIIDQTTMMFAAVLVWWPLVSPSLELPRLGRGWQLFYILFGTNFMMPVPVLLLIAQHPWYATYVHALGTSRSSAALADQQLGGIIMIAGMIVIYGIRAIATYASYDGQKWYD